MLSSFSLVGRLVADPELADVAGTPKADFRLAVDGCGGKGEDGKYSAGFFSVTAWDRNATFVGDHCKKGSFIMVTGTIRHETWKDKESGDNRQMVKFMADRISFVPGTKKAEGSDSEEQALEPVAAIPSKDEMADWIDPS